MQSLLGRRLLRVSIAVAFLTGCAGSSNGGVPNTASSLATAQNRFGQTGVIVDLSGEYIGRFYTQGQRGSRVGLFLSQSQSVLGGAVINKKGSQGLGGVIAWTVSGHTISGTAVAPEKGSGSGYCTFSMTGSYKYRRITGMYSAVYGCSSQTGNFTFWHKCYFQGTGSAVIRPAAGVKPC